MFDAVFFDFGGVILSSPFEAFAVYEQRVGLPPDAVRTINATNPDDNAWARFERSEIDVAEFVATFEREALELGFELSGADVLACLDGELRPEMVDVVRRCSADYTTALLTNNVVTMDAANLGANSAGHHAFGDVLSVFDVIVESSVVGRRKPQPEFYELACELADVEPSRVVFLDDLGINLKPARAMGMTTIKVGTDFGAAIVELEQHLGIALR
ncbi:MAG TPA: HAD-IA family hydrolase [Microthrixaceae bacterium]|jgi:putative hydrolase of the HAD superfamily|nr:HAD-IA family hydrolase [Microthrixaceae bacterium]